MSLMLTPQGLPYGNKKLYQIMGNNYAAAFEKEERLMMRLDPGLKDDDVRRNRARNHGAFAVVIKSRVGDCLFKGVGVPTGGPSPG
jgi:hypothetical protein